MASLDIKSNTEFDHETILKIVTCYSETEKKVLRHFDTTTYDPVLIKCYLEDVIWKEFNIELNEFIEYCEKQLHDKEIEIKFGDLRSSLSSIYRNESLLFK